MHPQLTEIDAELEAASARLGQLARNASEAEWTRRPPSGGWSPAECVAHLVLSSRGAIPHLEGGIAEARARGSGASGRMRKDFVGWLLWLSMRPGKGMKVKTTAPFVPGGDLDRTQLVNEFDGLQAELQRLLDEADGLPIDRVKIGSAFNEKVRYSLYSAFSVLAIHEHRHLLQAERALAAGREAAA